MGGETAAGPAVLHVRLPTSADVLVVRDGAPLHRAQAATLDLSNPIYFR